MFDWIFAILRHFLPQQQPCTALNGCCPGCVIP